MSEGFKDLRVWKKSKDLAVFVYRLAKTTELKNDFGMRDQMCRSSDSVHSNIAEGDERDTDKDCIRFLYIAKGSLAELRTHAEIAFEIGYLPQHSIQH